MSEKQLADYLDKLRDDLAEILLWPDLPEDAAGRIGIAITRVANIKMMLNKERETR